MVTATATAVAAMTMTMKTAIYVHSSFYAKYRYLMLLPLLYSRLEVGRVNQSVHAKTLSGIIVREIRERI